MLRYRRRLSLEPLEERALLDGLGILDDPATLTLSIADASISEGAGAGATTATVTRNDADLSSPLVVRITSLDDTELIPELNEVTIDAGEASATFDLAAVDDVTLDGTQTAVLVASEVGDPPLVTFDDTFGTSGVVTTDLLDGPNAVPVVRVQEDGKVVAVGRSPIAPSTWTVIRLNPDGTPDNGFGTGGAVTTTFIGVSGTAFAPRAVDVDADGRIVVVGGAFGADSGAVAARYNTDGTPDATFGVDGQVVLQVPSAMVAMDLVPNADGSMFVLGHTRFANNTDEDVYLAKVATDGSVEFTQTFDTGRSIRMYDLAVQADGQLGAAGESIGGGDVEFLVARFNPSDGSLDTTFSDDGYSTFGIEGSSYDAEAFRLAVQPDGKIVVGGVNVLHPNVWAAARLNADGTLDTGFDGDGTTTIPIGSSMPLGGRPLDVDVLLEPDGRIIMTGVSWDESYVAGRSFARLNADGSPDLSFGFAGTQVINTGADVTFSGATLQDDGKLVALAADSSGAISVERFLVPPATRVATQTIEVTDDDVAGFTVTESDGGTVVSETGTTDTFDVVLDVQPLSNVVISVVPGDPGEATVDKSSLTFTPNNWNAAQTVTVTGVDDPDRDGDQITSVTLSIDDSRSNDGFDPLPDQAVSVTTLDDESIPGEVRGMKWNDLVFDGVHNTGEPGLAGVTIYLDLNENGQFDDGEPTTLTLEDDPETPEDETGRFALTDILMDRYTVAEVLPEGWAQSYPSSQLPPAEMVSLAPDGEPADTSVNETAISADGRIVVFRSLARNLHPNADNSWYDIFAYDRETGTIRHVSVATDGAAGNGDSYSPGISADGRYVVFYSDASNLVPGDTNGRYDVFVHDLETWTTERVSVAADGSEAVNGARYPSISSHGRYVAFVSSSNNLVPGDSNGVEDILVKDRVTGEVELVSVGAGGQQANAHCSDPVITPDGRFVAFASYANSLVPGDTNGQKDVFVYERQPGHYDGQAGAIERVSVAADGSQADGSSEKPAISDDGRFVAFTSNAPNLVDGDTNGLYDVFVRDRQVETTFRASVTWTGDQIESVSYNPSISADGRYVVFDSYGTGIVPDDAGTASDVFVFDRTTGEVARVSVAWDGDDPSSNSLDAAVSDDGRAVVFRSSADNLDPEHATLQTEAYVALNPLAFIPGTHSVHVGPGEIVDGIEFGNQVEFDPGEIRGMAWDDIDADGRRDDGEAGLAGVTVYLDLNTNGQFDEGEPTAVTGDDDPGTPEDETGRYAFTGVAAGTYVIGEVSPDGWQQTHPDPAGGGTHQRALAPGEVAEGLDFGIWHEHTLPLGPELELWRPFGSQVYEATVAKRILAPWYFNRYWVELEAGQTVSLKAWPVYSWQGEMMLHDPAGNLVGSDSGSTDPSRPLVLQNAPVQTTGVYTITLASRQEEEESVRLRVVLNAALEGESISWSINDDAARAEDIDGFFTPIALGTGERVAIYGDGENQDWYRFTLEDGQSISAALAGPWSGTWGLELRDAGENLLLRGTLAEDGLWVIDRFVDPTDDGVPDTYYLRVRTAYDQETKYVLLANRRAAFDGGPLWADPVDISDTGTALGALNQYPLRFEQQAEFGLPPVSNELSYFGRAVAVDGNWALVGAPCADPNGERSGLVSVYRREGSAWVHFQDLNASDGISFDQFGSAVAVQGDTAMVGAPPAGTDNAGTVYVFEFDGQNWVEAQKLVGSRASGSSQFGGAIDVDGDRAVVGAQGDFGASSRAGAVYVFHFDGSQWVEEQRLLASDGGYQRFFGQTLDLDGDNLIVGSESSNWGDAAYMFHYDGATWNETQIFLGSGWYGDSVALSGDHAMVGDPFGWHVYTYRFDGSQWVGGQPLDAFSMLAPGYFGVSVAIREDMAVIGTEDDAAFVYWFDGNKWIAVQMLRADTSAAGEEFGCCLALGDGVLLVGDQRSDLSGTDSGAAYVFEDLWSPEEDVYTFEAVGGEPLLIATATPTVGAGPLANGLDPVIEVYDPDGTLVATDDNGAGDGRNARVFLPDSSPGTYEVRITGVGDTRGDYMLAAGDGFGVIRGVAWEDLDGDGFKDEGEPGTAGWEVYLDANENGQYDDGEPLVTTGDGGEYAFSEVAPGDHLVAQRPQAGWEATYPGSGLRKISEGADGHSWYASLSGDGRYVAFVSLASNLVPDDTNGERDVFVFDRLTGQIERVSVADDGTEGEIESNVPSISGDGRYVAFTSYAENLVPGDTNFCSDAFVYDRQTRTVKRISLTSDGTEGDWNSYSPEISYDGRYVAFYTMSALVPEDTNDVHDVYVYDLQTDAIEWVSVAYDQSDNDWESYYPSISADGRFVSFTSDATNLVPDDTNDAADIFVYDRQMQTIERVSVADDGSEGDDGSWNSWLSADGRLVAFDSDATNLVPDDFNADTDVFVYDRQLQTIERVSVSYDGSPVDGGSEFPSISGDGRYVVFDTWATNLIPDDANEAVDVVVYDRTAGTMQLVSKADDGSQLDFDTFTATISHDGSYVGFDSTTWDMLMGYDPTIGHLFVAGGPAIAFPGTHRVSVEPGQTVAEVDFGNYANHAPEAVDDGYTLQEGSTLDVPASGVLANDADLNGDELTATLVDEPAHGTLMFDADGSFTYTPEAAYFGEDTFAYYASDSQADSDTATVTLTVEAVPSLDVDANGEADALSDGVVILRYLFGFTGQAMIEDAVSPEALRPDADRIAAFLDACREAMLDVDANGAADALTDGILILRHLFDFTGPTLVEGALAPDATRTDPDEIAAFLDQFDPGVQLVPTTASSQTQASTGAEQLAIAAPLGVVERSSSAPAGPDRPQSVDLASGKFDPPAQAVDNVLGSQAASGDFLEPLLDDPALFASGQKRSERSTADVLREELYANLPHEKLPDRLL